MDEAAPGCAEYELFDTAVAHEESAGNNVPEATGSHVLVLVLLLLLPLVLPPSAHGAMLEELSWRSTWCWMEARQLRYEVSANAQARLGHANAADTALAVTSIPHSALTEAAKEVQFLTNAGCS